MLQKLKILVKSGFFSPFCCNFTTNSRICVYFVQRCFTLYSKNNPFIVLEKLTPKIYKSDGLL